jgi:hypothetical protein
MAKDPEFLILKYPIGWLPEDQWTEILGTAVKDPWSPTNGFVPDNALFYNKIKLLENEFEDFILSKEYLVGGTSELRVKGLGNLYRSKKDGQQLDLNGKVIYIKRLRRHDDFWKEITTNNEEFRERVTEWLAEKSWRGRPKYPVCLVVGLLMCQDVVVTASDEEARQRELRGEVPVGTIVEAAAASQGIPLQTGGAGNVAATVSGNVVRRTYFEATGSGKKVFALELKLISSKKGKLILSNEAPKSDRTLGNDDDEADPDDLITTDLEPEDWERLLQAEEQDE